MTNARGGWWLVLVVLLSFFVFRHSSLGQTGLKIQLVSEQSAVVPGRSFTVGLWIQHDRGWHTYWRHPGIVGVPTQMLWKLPKGWKAGPLVFPEPERTLMFQIKAQGFDRDVMLRTEITPPAGLEPGTTVTLTGKAVWMCCGNTCHPDAKDMSLTLPVSTHSTLNEKWHRLLAAERARAERVSDAWKAEALEKGTQITLTLRPLDARATLRSNQRDAEKIIVFTEDGWFDSDKPQVVTLHSDGTLSIQLTKADTYLGGTPPKTLRCILRHEGGWVKGEGWNCLQVSPTIVRR